MGDLHRNQKIIDAVADEIRKYGAFGEISVNGPSPSNESDEAVNIEFRPNNVNSAAFTLNAFADSGIVTVEVGRSGRFEFVSKDLNRDEIMQSVLSMIRAVSAGDVHQRISSVGDVSVKIETHIGSDPNSFNSTVFRGGWRLLVPRRTSNVVEFDAWNDESHSESLVPDET